MGKKWIKSRQKADKRRTQSGWIWDSSFWSLNFFGPLRIYPIRDLRLFHFSGRSNLSSSTDCQNADAMKRLYLGESIWFPLFSPHGAFTKQSFIKKLRQFEKRLKKNLMMDTEKASRNVFPTSKTLSLKKTLVQCSDGKRNPWYLYININIYIYIYIYTGWA